MTSMYENFNCNKRKRLYKKRVQLPQDWFGTPTWRPFYLGHQCGRRDVIRKRSTFEHQRDKQPRVPRLHITEESVLWY